MVVVEEAQTLSSKLAEKEVIRMIDRTKFAESLKEILMNCDDVRANTDWFEAVLYAYSKMLNNDYVLNVETVTWIDPIKASTLSEYGGRGGGPYTVTYHGGGGGNWRDW